MTLVRPGRRGSLCHRESTDIVKFLYDQQREALAPEIRLAPDTYQTVADADAWFGAMLSGRCMIAAGQPKDLAKIAVALKREGIEAEFASIYADDTAVDKVREELAKRLVVEEEARKHDEADTRQKAERREIEQSSASTPPQTRIASVAITGPVAAPVPEAGFSDVDLPKIRETSKSNDLRFNIDYRGKTFASEGTFQKAAENLFIDGQYRVTVRTSGGTVDCIITDSATLRQASDWSRGRPVLIRGPIETTLMGDLQLAKGCTVVGR